MFGWASRILNHFDQRKQRVETQINIGTAYGYSLPRKIDPRLALAPYLLDRSEQRTALMSYLAEKHWGGQTLSIVALGSEQHLPEALALTVFQLLSREFFPRAGLAALRPPTSPLCLEWPNNSKRGQLNWEAVAKYCLSAEPSGGMTRELLFANLKGSLIFGFHADFATWSSRSSDVCAWIHETAHAPCPADSLTVSVTILSSPTRSQEKLQALYADLSERFKADRNVLLLSPLGPVSRQDVRLWRQEIMLDREYGFLESHLQTLVSDLFPGELETRAMSEIWEETLGRLREAWLANERP